MRGHAITDCKSQKKEAVILITGFEPFDQDPVNPSWQAVRQLPERIGGCRIVRKEIPVEFNRGADEILRLAEELNADALICCGFSKSARALTLEYAALNLQHARIADNAGYQPCHRRIRKNAPLALESALPVFELESILKRRGLPVQISFSAGTYVCNDVMYRILEFCGQRGISGGFIHIPPFASSGEENGADWPGQAAVLEGLNLILHCLAEKLAGSRNETGEDSEEEN